MPEFVRRLRQFVPADELLQIPSVTIVLRDGNGRVLLGRHTEGDRWLLPGGTIEPGESPGDAAVREMWEETGKVVRLTKLVGVFGGEAYIVRYRNGDRTSYVTTVFEAVAEEALVAPRLDESELKEVRFVTKEEAPDLVKTTWVLEVLEAVFSNQQRAVFARPVWRPPI